MGKHNVAIVGLGRVGSIFLDKTLGKSDVIRVKAVCELYDTQGRKQAEKEGIPVMDLSEVIALGVDIDIIFDLTGDENVTCGLRRKLNKAGNTYTQVAQNRLARLVWSLISDDQYLPDLRKSKSQVYADMLLSCQK